jgi:hypothetical protein
MEKMPSAGQDVVLDTPSSLSPLSRPKIGFPPSNFNPNETDPSLSSSNKVRGYTLVSTQPFSLTFPQGKTLHRSVSLSSIPKQSEAKNIQYFSAMDDSFYPLYLRRPHLLPTSLPSHSADELEVASSISISRSLIDRIPLELPSLDYEPTYTYTAALWERASWEVIDQAPVEKISSSGNHTSAPENTIASKWNAIVMGGG